MTPTVSLAITAGREASRVRALIELLRPVVDEVVLAVDSRRAETTLPACIDLVDRALTYEFEGTPARYIGWVHHQCSADWILQLDDDEAPGTVLLESLPELIADRALTHVMLPCRELWPGCDTWLACHPWAPNYHNRLVRNVPGIWSFDGRVHREAEVLGEGRRVPEACFYHLRRTIDSSDVRLEAVRRCERHAPGLATESYPVNAMYLPELWSGLTTAPVPAGDRPLIDAVAHPRPARAVGGRARLDAVERATVADVDLYNMSRAVSSGAYRAELAVTDRRRRLAAGTAAYVEVTARNLGSERWPPGHQGAPLIRLAYRWLADDGVTVVEAEGLRTPFEETVAPGATTVAMAAIAAPAEPGHYVLEVDVVHELVRWFDCAVRERFAVEPLAVPAIGSGPAMNGHGPPLARPDLSRIPVAPAQTR